MVIELLILGPFIDSRYYVHVHVDVGLHHYVIDIKWAVLDIQFLLAFFCNQQLLLVPYTCVTICFCLTFYLISK